MLGKLIQAGERRRFGNRDYAHWTHSALIVSETGEIVEAIESGVKQANISKYRDTDYVVVHIEEALPSAREHAVEFAREMSKLHEKYGVLNFIALAFQALFGWSTRRAICFADEWQAAEADRRHVCGTEQQDSSRNDPPV